MAAFSSENGLALLHRLGERDVGTGPGGTQLGVVGHRADQGVMEAEPLHGNELGLIDQLGGDEFGQALGLGLGHHHL